MSIPKHVAIIMDGNGRWAKSRGHTRAYGHVRGANRVESVVRACGDAGVEALTLYAFSTENWNRPKKELDVLWKLFEKFLKKFQVELHKQNVKLHVIGERERLSDSLNHVIDQSVGKLEKNTGLQLTLAISYGSKKEIENAMKCFAEDCLKGLRKPTDLNEELIDSYMWTKVLGPLAPVDLLIRTSGEKRMSNFLLWQSAYSEIIFKESHWPEFTVNDLYDCFDEYSKRDRRFGGLKVSKNISTQNEIQIHAQSQ